jgi:hypothetical protein
MKLRTKLIVSCLFILIFALSGCTNSDQSQTINNQSFSPAFQDYKNETYKFSIKYPSDWLPHENVIPETIGFISPESAPSQADIGINYQEVGVPNSLGSIQHHEQLMAQAVNTLESVQGCVVVKTSEIPIQTSSQPIPAYKSKLECLNNDLYLVKVVANNGQYFLSFATPKGSTKYNSIIDTMFANFKIDRDDLNSKYVEFTDKSQGYAIHYPYYWRVFQTEEEKVILDLSPPDDDSSLFQFKVAQIDKSEYDLNGWKESIYDNMAQVGGIITTETDTTTTILENGTSFEIPAVQFTSDVESEDEKLKTIFKIFIYGDKGYTLYFASSEENYLDHRGQALDIIKSFELVK